MNRYNSFYLIHKGLRAMLYDAALTLQQTDFSKNEESMNALAKVNDALFAFSNHAHHEDHFIFPMVELHEPALAESFEKEHVEDHRLSDCLKNLLAIYENAMLDEERIVCGSAITKSFIEFMVFNLQHMGKEEIYINEALWKYYTDEQIISESQKLIASIPPAEMQFVAKWMLRGISTAETINWLKSIKRSSPEPAFNGLMNLAQSVLSKIQFDIVQEALEEEVLA
jgi:hypothetical protein